MTKSYQIKTYLIDCHGYSVEDLEGMNLDELLNLIDDKKYCAQFLEVPLSYLN